MQTYRLLWTGYVQYVNKKSVGWPAFKSFEHMNQHMEEEAATNVDVLEGDTSDSKETED